FLSVAADRLVTPDSGRKTIGSRAVTGMGMASVAHQIAINAVNATTIHASSVSPSGGAVMRTTAATISPSRNPAFPIGECISDLLHPTRRTGTALRVESSVRCHDQHPRRRAINRGHASFGLIGHLACSCSQFQ